jgi:hypothetical protein
MVTCSVYEGGLGLLVDPESDTKEVFIPSPPSMVQVKVHPRDAVVLVSGGVVRQGWSELAALEEYAESNKVAILCPFSDDPEEVAKSYLWLERKCRSLNIRYGCWRVMATEGELEAARGVVDYLVTKLDADLDKAEVLAL